MMRTTRSGASTQLRLSTLVEVRAWGEKGPFLGAKRPTAITSITASSCRPLVCGVAHSGTCSSSLSMRNLHRRAAVAVNAERSVHETPDVGLAHVEKLDSMLCTARTGVTRQQERRKRSVPTGLVSVCTGSLSAHGPGTAASTDVRVLYLCDWQHLTVKSGFTRMEALLTAHGPCILSHAHCQVKNVKAH